MKVLITGGAGFVGTNLTQFLLETTDWQLVILDNFSAEVKHNLNWISNQKEGRVKVVEGDIRNKQDVENAIEGCEFVVNLAAQVGVIDSQEDPYLDAEININGLINVLEAARSLNVNKVVHASSAAPLGEQEPPLTEQDVPQPLAPYGASKLAGEGYCSAYAGSFGLKTVALRFSNVYGRHSLHKDSVIPLFVRQMLRKEAVTIYGDGQQTRDFIDARDIARAIYLALTTDLDNNFELFQIGTGHETSVKQLYDLIRQELEASSLEVKAPDFKDKRAGEIERNYVEITRAEKLLDYRPQVTLKKGLKDLIGWYQNLDVSNIS